MKIRYLLSLSLLLASGFLWVASSAIAGSVLHGTAAGRPTTTVEQTGSGSPVQPGNGESVPTGRFNGYSRKSGKIWIGDFAFMKHPRLQVVGSGSKLGSLSSIREGEEIEFITVANPDRPHMPYIVKIWRI